MKELSSFFFIMAPFGFFCTGGGAGIYAGFIFLILGIVFANWEKIGGNPNAVKIPSEQFWEWHYIDGLTIRGMKDYDARDWATYVCGAHNAWIPPDFKQEEIAQKILHPKGDRTYKEKETERKHLDRIQFGKWHLLRELEQEYKKMGEEQFYKVEIPKHPNTPNVSYWAFLHDIRNCYSEIEECFGKINPFWFPSDYQRKFGVPTEEEAWSKALSNSERYEAKKWVSECVDRVFREIHNRERPQRNSYEYKKKYGFNVWREDLA